MPDDRYVVTRRSGVDTLHRNPREECNLDDSERDEQVDEFTAEALILNGDAIACGHCNPGIA